MRRKESSDKLSPLELEVMEVLWRLESASMQEMEEALPKRKQVGEMTRSALQREKRPHDSLRFP